MLFISGLLCVGRVRSVRFFLVWWRWSGVMSSIGLICLVVFLFVFFVLGFVCGFWDGWLVDLV